jgi:hypothetical protein
MKTFTITTRTRKLGWGYTCWTKPGDTPSRPEITGTAGQILEYIRNSRDYQIMLAGGTYIAEQWFYDGKPIKSVDYPHDTDILICELGQDSEQRLRDRLKITFA